MIKRRALCLALCLLLTACGVGEERPEPPEPLLGRAAELEEESVLLVVDGREIPAWQYLYWLARACDTLCAEDRAAGRETDWTAEVGGQSLADYAKSQALTDTVLYAVVENWAEESGCTGETGGSTLLQSLPELGLDEERALRLERVGLLYARLYRLFRTEGSGISPAEEALASFADGNGWAGYERILVPFGEDRNAARTRAEALFSRLNAAEDAVGEFAALAAEEADPAPPRTVCLADAAPGDVLADALEHLAVGQYSGILETDEGFSILLRCPPEREALLEPYFDHLLQTKVNEVRVQSAAAYGALEVPAFYRALQRLRQETLLPQEDGGGK